LANRSDRSTWSNQSEFSFIQINKSYGGALLNAIQLLARRQSTELAKKTRNSRQQKPADGVNPSGWGDCILAALNSAIAPKLKVTCKKKLARFLEPPT
jgi:hypothetical protein